MSHVAAMSASGSEFPVQTNVNGDDVVGHVSPVVVVVVVVFFAKTMILSILSTLFAAYYLVMQLGSLLHCAGGEIWTVSLAGLAVELVAAATTKAPPQVQVIEVEWQWRRQV